MSASTTRNERLRSKHTKEFDKLQARKEDLKKKGNVSSWLEVFVLMNEDKARFKQPVAPHLAYVDVNKVKNPFVHAGIVIPPNLQKTASQLQVKQQQQQQQSTSPRAGGNTPVFAAYEQLPTPQNPKLVLANDRKMYDNALDEQLEMELVRLAQLENEPSATNRQILAQRALVDQLKQQREMVQLQQAQNLANKKRVQNKPAAAKAATAVAEKPALTLEERLKKFFAKHEPEAITDGRVEAVLIWTEERGEDKLNAMLREQYGRDLNGQLNVESTFVDQVQADRIARRLLGFYQAKNVRNMPLEECQKIGEWACKAGEAALNNKLRTKYNDDLDSYAQSVMLQVEAKLRAFYQEKNPVMMKEKGIGPLLTWTVSNGIDALNDLLLDKYGADLKGRKRDAGEEKQDITKTSRSIMYRELQREPSVYAASAAASVASQSVHGGEEDGEDDILQQRKDLLIKQLASFLEVNDPRRLVQGGLVPLVQWALPRSDKQVDELLLETYGTDLEDAGLRRLEFDEKEVEVFHRADEQSRLHDSIAYRAGKAASVAMEDEMARAEIRSLRATTLDDPIVALPQMFEDDEPDF